MKSTRSNARNVPGEMPEAQNGWSSGSQKERETERELQVWIQP